MGVLHLRSQSQLSAAFLRISLSIVLLVFLVSRHFTRSVRFAVVGPLAGAIEELVIKCSVSSL